MSAKATIARRIKIEGRVQGVFFRDSVRRLARHVGVSGWVRNLADGSVEAHLEGPASAVDEVLDFCRSGPPGARVENVSIQDTEPAHFSDFRIIR